VTSSRSESPGNPSAVGGKTTVWLDVNAAAALSACSVPTIRRAVRAGRLRAARINGNRLRFKPDWIESWLLREPAEVVFRRPRG
jgi:excisionase family DNA binding protein